MALPPIPKQKEEKERKKGLSNDDPINIALRQLEQYEEGTPKRSIKEHDDCPHSHNGGIE